MMSSHSSLPSLRNSRLSVSWLTMKPAVSASSYVAVSIMRAMSPERNQLVHAIRQYAELLFQAEGVAKVLYRTQYAALGVL